MITDPQKLKTVLVTDCGSTTTKALLFERKDDGWHQTSRGEAPTTVEEPVADVTVGAENAFSEIQELSGRKILSGTNKAAHPFVESSSDGKDGIDLYLSTSSAGGGLQMMVAGIVKTMSAESAERAALGAGAIILDAISADDGREDHERIARIRHLRPDIVLLCGGVDGGSRSHVIEMAEILLAAAPKPRFGDTLKLPVIYAGNREATEEVKRILAPIAQVTCVDNVRPTLDSENAAPAREAIHDFFLTHVMSHSPGYGKLLKWSPVPIMPTPAAVGDVVMSFATRTKTQVLCADIGGATTDVFSVFRDEEDVPVLHRTVSANLGMSYSMANVLVEAGTAGIKRWLPFEIADSDLRDRLRNKMIRPTSIPQTKEELWIEQAVCREALRLSLQHHRSLAVGLAGRQQRRGISEIFNQKASRYQMVDMMALDMVIGSGGVLSHAPSRLEAALMMLDGFMLEGLTELAVDSIFMMPHLGVLSSIHPEAALQIFERDCLVRIGHSVVPLYPQRFERVNELATVSFNGQAVGTVKRNEVGRISLTPQQTGEISIQPSDNRINVGAGAGKAVTRQITIGIEGILLDGRNRPMSFSAEPQEVVRKQKSIYKSLGLE